MKKIFLSSFIKTQFIMILVLYNAYSINANINSINNNNPIFEIDKLYIKFKPNTEFTNQWLSNKINTIEELKNSLGEHKIRPYVRSELLTAFQRKIIDTIQDEQLKSYIHNSLTNLGLCGILEINSDLPLELFETALSNLSFIEFVERVPINYFSTEIQDELSEQQYNISLTKAKEAWELLKPSRPIIVAIVDTGIDTAHPDLHDNIWKNSGETGFDSYGNPKESNGIDDDNNGFIDDFYGWDFFYDDNTATNGIAHGTHVAGIVGAIHNTIGIAGLAKNVKLMSIKIGADNLSSYAVINGGEAIIYAAMLGADIINCSWGGYKSSYAENEAFKLVSKLATIVCAAGNDGQEINIYPSYDDNVLSVVALNIDKKRPKYSNYGVSSGIAAPGHKIISTIPGNAYSNMSGTSMATPAVAAAAAMVKNNFPEYTSEQIIARLKATAENIEVENPELEKLKIGMVDIYNALKSDDCKYIKMDNVKINNIKTNKFSNTNIYVNPEEEITIKSDIKNLLDKASGVYANIYAENIEFENNSILIGDIEANTTLFDFFEINGKVKNINENDITENIYIYFYDNNNKFISTNILTLGIAPSWNTISHNNITCSYTNNGEFAYKNKLPIITENNGLGFSYKNYYNLLFSGGLIIATSSQNVMSNIIGKTKNKKDSSFINIDNNIITFETEDKLHHAETIKYLAYKKDDTTFSNPFIEITQTLFESKEQLLNNMLFVNYKLKNISNTDIDTLYLGMYMDWDIAVCNKNNIAVDENKVVISYYSLNDTITPKITMKLLTKQQVNYSSIITYDAEKDKDYIYEGYLDTVKWKNLTNKLIEPVPAFTTDSDIAMLLGGGAVNIPKDSSETFIFVITANENKNIALQQINIAEEFIKTIDLNNLSINNNEENKDIEFYTNINDYNILNYSIKGINKGKYKISIFDINANELYNNNIYVYENNINYGNIDISKLFSGTYFLVIENKDKLYRTNFIITR